MGHEGDWKNRWTEWIMHFIIFTKSSLYFVWRLMSFKLLSSWSLKESEAAGFERWEWCELRQWQIYKSTRQNSEKCMRVSRVNVKCSLNKTWLEYSFSVMNNFFCKFFVMPKAKTCLGWVTVCRLEKMVA